MIKDRSTAQDKYAFQFDKAFKSLPAIHVFDHVQQELDALFDHEALTPFSAQKKYFGPLFQTSSYLLSCARRHPQALAEIIETGPDMCVLEIINETKDCWAYQDTLLKLGKYLRQAKQKITLALGIAELGGILSTKQVVHQLSAFADAAVYAALNGVVGQQLGQTPDPQYPPAARSGLFILAMGKLGGFELNYSSDIDIIFYYEAPKAEAFFNQTNLVRYFTRLVRDFLTLCQEHNEDGYLFRVDLRLRPDPGATPSALSTEAALHYYQTRGRTWERTAYIKARCIAGDVEVANQFMVELTPFIWRKYLDFSALEQIHDLKKQLHRVRGLGNIVASGHDVKRGRGGIREIEFFVQIQLLIAGGRDLDLRLSSTQKGLEILAEKGWVNSQLSQKLIDHYWFLRAVENRMQMVADSQTHQVPEDEAARHNIAIMMGFDDLSSFDTHLVEVLNQVCSAYDDIFASNETDDNNTGRQLNFHTSKADQKALEALARFGFVNPAHAYQLVHRLVESDVPALQTHQAQHILDQLLPNLLAAMGETGQADKALINFDRFTRSLPMGVQLFALLAANGSLLKLLIDILGTAPRLADLVARRPHIFDSLLEPQFFTQLPAYDTLKKRIEDFVNQARSFEDGLDRARVIGQEFKFFISVRLLARAITPLQASKAFSHLAQIITAQIFFMVRQDIEARFGHIDRAQWVILAMGRLGSEEMSATSDLDLILLYDHPDDVKGSTGARRLDPPVYFARATQRLIAGLTAPTAQGILYEADMRLRPSGRAGPLATRFKAFQIYQRHHAWTWEHQALTRARVVAGDPQLKNKVHEEINDLITQKRVSSVVKKDVAAMRIRLLRDRPTRFHWHIKLVRGGLVDVEFIAQAYVLMHAHQYPWILKKHTRAILLALATHKLITVSQAEILIQAYDFYVLLLQLLAISYEGRLAPDNFSSGLKQRLVTHSQMPDFEFVDAELLRMQAEVADLFEALIGTPETNSTTSN